ncbi:MAG TPA: PQQ-binding-like beta-propeller repeat protein [Methylovirgula sp.]|nr:PQQ-binding-like beta-propeller repeat protein [Methylovirgula sp.]
MRIVPVLVAAVLMAVTCSTHATPVLSYHGGPERSGHFVVPNLTWDRARSLHFDPAFHAEISGQLYAQPLYWHEPGSEAALLIAVTENNIVYALDAKTGKTVWSRSLGQPVARALLPCGDIAPLGVTGTPVIDAASETLFLDAAVTQSTGPDHLVFALSLKDGSILPGWPVAVGAALAGQDPPFVPTGYNQRGALAVAGGTVYVPFGSFFDCKPYHGTVIGIPISDPHNMKRWVSRAMGGGVWAPGGITSDGTSLFVATGNTFDTADWADGEAVIRLPLDLQGPTEDVDYFTPEDWRDLDAEDSDLGGIAPVLIDLPDGDGQKPLVVALGKDGKAYLLDRTNLGGIGGALAVTKVSAHGVYAAAAAYPVGDSVYVVFPAAGTGCSDGQRGLAALAVHPGSPPTLSTAWCAQVTGLGAPIVTTTDGKSNPIVWDVGAEGDNQLHAFKGDTGEVLFSGTGLAGLHRFVTMIATKDHLYLGGDGKIYAFTF